MRQNFALVIDCYIDYSCKFSGETFFMTNGAYGEFLTNCKIFDSLVTTNNATKLPNSDTVDDQRLSQEEINRQKLLTSPLLTASTGISFVKMSKRLTTKLQEKSDEAMNCDNEESQLRPKEPDVPRRSSGRTRSAFTTANRVRQTTVAGRHQLCINLFSCQQLKDSTSEGN